MDATVRTFRKLAHAALAGYWSLALISICPAQRFQNPPLIATSPDPVGLVTADFNSDGNPDLAYVTVGEATVLHVLLGNGRGGFTPGATVTLPAGTCVFEDNLCFLTVGDFTHSGHPGILLPGMFTGNWGFVVLPGNGDGTFGTPVVSTVPPPEDFEGSFVPYRPGVADFTGSGNLDIAEPDFLDGQIRIYLGDGKGDMTAGPVLSDYEGLQPLAIYAADVNHDGKMDLVVLDGSGFAEVWLGDGTGNFTYSQKYPTDIQPTFVARAVADINGDGNADVIGSDGLGDVEVMTGNADGTFNAQQTIASGFEANFGIFTSVYPIDLTGSGIPDLVVNSAEGFDTAVATSALAYGPPQKRTSGPFLSEPAVADFNGDGAPDMAVGVAGGIELFFGNSSGKFPDSTITPTPVPSTFLFAGNFTGGGIADVTASGNDGLFRTYAGSSSGAFQSALVSPNPISTVFNYIGNAVGDFDGDGHEDILLSGNALFGNGDGVFTEVSGPVESNGLVADLNRDGVDDLLSVSATPQSGAGSYTFYYSLIAQLGSPERTFTEVSTNLTTPPTPLATGNPILFAAQDMNGDGIPDAVVYNPNFPEIEIWLGNGDGTFHEGTILPVGSAWTPLTSGVPGSTSAVADMDGDGNPDLVFLATEAAPDSALPLVTDVVIEYGDGKGDFAGSTVIPLSHAFTGLTLARPQTGALPGIVVYDGTQIAVLRNLGNRQFSGEESYSAGTISGVVSADFTGSGSDDLLILRANGGENPNPAANGFTVLMSMPATGGNGTGIANGSVSTSPSTVNYNQGFTATAVLAPSMTSAPTPTGLVSFSAEGLSLGSATLSGGSATVNVAGSVTELLPAGIITINVNYSGDSYYASQNFQVTLQILNPVYPTQTQLTLWAQGDPISSIEAGSFVTMTATVSAPVTVPRGYIAFYDGSTVLGQAEIASQQATISTNLLTIGTHSLSAQYLGFTPPAAQVGTSIFLDSTSPPVGLTITGAATTATLTPSASSVSAGTVLTLTTKVSSAAGTPIGGVTFFDGNTALGTLTLDSTGSAALSTASLTSGTHSITAQYEANGIYASSATAASIVTVTTPSAALAPTFTSIVSVLPSSTGATAVSVQVIGARGGSVTLIADGRRAASKKVSASGAAVIPDDLSGAGVHVLSVSYSGGEGAAASVSPQLNTTAYTGSDFTLSAGPMRMDPGGAESVAVSVGAVGSWNGTATFQCAAGVPEGYACIFSPAARTGSGTTVLSIKRTASLPFSVELLLPLPLLWVSRRLRRTRRRMALLLGLSLLFLSGCSVRSADSPASMRIISVQASDGTHVHSVQIAAALPAA